MRKIALLYCLCLFWTSGKTQDTNNRKIKIGLGAVVAIPANNLNESSIGAGGDLLVMYSVSDKLNLSGDVGFTALAGKGVFSSTGLIPIRLGIRYLPGSNFYLGAKLGVGIYTILEESTSYFAYSIGAGYMLNKRFDIGASYDGYSKSDISFGIMAVRLGYSFGK